jgi:hypothetical protein
MVNVWSALIIFLTYGSWGLYLLRFDLDIIDISLIPVALLTWLAIYISGM